MSVWVPKNWTIFLHRGGEEGEKRGEKKKREREEEKEEKGEGQRGKKEGNLIFLTTIGLVKP